MKDVKIEKVVLSVGGTGDYLDKGVKLLKMLTERKPAVIKTRKRIPALGVRPGREVGTVVTIRKNKEDMLNKLLQAENNTIKKKQLSENTFSFGVREYIEIPGVEYNREIGIMGFDVTVTFKRAGRRIRLKKRKKGKIPKRQEVSKDEIMKLMENKFQTKFT